VFHADSYGYRPGKSAIDAVHQARQRCWRYDWVLDLDIKGFFDSIDWGLLLKAIRHHTDCPWALLYIERWLKAPVQMEDGSVAPIEAEPAVVPVAGRLTDSMAKLCGAIRTKTGYLRARAKFQARCVIRATARLIGIKHSRIAPQKNLRKV
jgi:hypothetical protein